MFELTDDLVEDDGDLGGGEGGRQVRPQVQQHLERRGAPHPLLSFYASIIVPNVLPEYGSKSREMSSFLEFCQYRVRR